MKWAMIIHVRVGYIFRVAKDWSHWTWSLKGGLLAKKGRLRGYYLGDLWSLVLFMIGFDGDIHFYWSNDAL